MPKDKKIQLIADRWTQAQAEREKCVNAKWKDISEYFCPERGRFESSEQEPDASQTLRGGSILDSTGRYALRTATNGMFSGLTAPTSRWFRLSFVDERMRKNASASDWLTRLEDAVYRAFRRSNWYPAVLSLDAEVLAFASGCMFMQGDFKEVLRFRTFTAGEYWWGQNDDGRVDTVYRRIMMTAYQMASRFGKDGLSRQAQEDSEKNPVKPYEVLHVVGPREAYDPGKMDRANMPWQSMYLEVGSDFGLLRESGFKRFPFITPRYDTVGNDAYGCASPGWESLPDNKMLQDIEETGLRLSHKTAEPPMIAPTSLKGQPLRSGAGGITYADGTGNEQLRPLYQVQGRMNDLSEKQAEVRQRILRSWYYDIFLMIEQTRGNVTATEIMEKVEEKKLQLGPFIQRHEDDVLDPAVEFAVEEIIARGVIEPPPPEIQEAGYDIEYISPLAQAQRMQSAKSISGTLAFVGNAAAVQPRVLDVIDWDEAAREYADMSGAPAKIILPPDVVKTIRSSREQAMQRQQQAANMAAMVQGAQQLGNTPTDPSQPNALTDIMRMVQGQTGALNG